MIPELDLRYIVFCTCGSPSCPAALFNHEDAAFEHIADVKESFTQLIFEINLYTRECKLFYDSDSDPQDKESQ